MRGVDDIAGELRTGIAITKKLVAGARLHQAIADADAPVKLHEAVQIRHAADMAAKLVGGIHQRINPHAFAKIFRVDTAIPHLGLSTKNKTHQQDHCGREFKSGP